MCYFSSQVSGGYNVSVKHHSPTADVTHLQEGDGRAQVFGHHQSSESGHYV